MEIHQYDPMDKDIEEYAAKTAVRKQFVINEMLALLLGGKKRSSLPIRQLRQELAEMEVHGTSGREIINQLQERLDPPNV